jgi:hypothetical protein
MYQSPRTERKGQEYSAKILKIFFELGEKQWQRK